MLLNTVKLLCSILIYNNLNFINYFIMPQQSKIRVRNLKNLEKVNNTHMRGTESDHQLCLNQGM